METVVPELEVDYDRLASWLVDQVGGAGARLAGAWYYTGHSGQAGLERFLHGLEHRKGFFVRRHRNVEREQACPRCGQNSLVRVEKGVDVRIAVDMVQRVMTGQLDAVVLLSGDEDLLPAVQAVQVLGRPVWLASWNGQALAPALRAEAYGHLDLIDGIEGFGTGRSRAPEAAGAASADELVMVQARAAIDFFVQRGRHLSRWYFENRWEVEPGTSLDRDRRIQSLERLLAEGTLEVYEADINGRRVDALRLRAEAP